MSNETKMYIVEVREQHIARFEVEAETEEQAAEMVLKGKGSYVEKSRRYIGLEEHLNWMGETDNGISYIFPKD